MDEKSLSHTSWNCKYHIVLVPKYRRKVIYGKLRKDIGKILRMLCDYNHVEIIETHAMSDHIHMLLSIPPKLAVADFMGYLKGKSTLMIFERHANMKYKYGRRVFWTKGYYVNTVGGNEAKIRKYIRDQEADDQMCDQLSFKEHEDPFKNVADFDDDDSPEVPTDTMKTLALLSQAKDNLANSYVGRVERGFENYANTLMGNQLGDVMVDKDLHLYIDEKGAAREVGSFSAGTIDCIMLCMRLSLVDALFGDEKPFLILDDPFVNLDDEHTKRALEMLDRIAQDHQVVYLVCNTSRK